MTKRKPRELAAEAQRRNREQLAALGGKLRAARLRRRATQQAMAALAGISRSSWSDVERGLGGGHTMDTWQRVGLAVGTSLIVDLPRDVMTDTADAGHLGIQELMLGLGRKTSFSGFFELPTKPGEPWRSTDVALRSDSRRLLILEECWNTIGDVGAATRSTNRKIAEAEALAIAIGGDRPYAVRCVWIVRASARNRALVQRYPEVFARSFPGSSHGWTAALTLGADPPEKRGLVWCDVESTRVFAWRRR
jgi:transcriptional regulator with XRE-family HTH domain